MTKSDDKGEPVKTVTIGGKKVEVPIIFVLPEEAGEKEIERYEHPKVHIESKKIAPLLGAGGIGGAASGIAGGVASAGKKIGEDIKDTAEQAPQAIGEGAKLSESLSADSEEEPLDKLTHGKLEEVEKLPYKDQLQGTIMDETRAVESGKVRPKQNKHLIDPKWKGYSDDFKEGGFKQQEAPKEEEETTPYFDLLSDKPKKKKKKKKEDVSYRALFDKGYGKAQALRRSVEEQKKRGAKTDDELAEESKKKIPKGQKGMLNYNYLFDKPDIEEKDYLTDDEGDEIEKSWERWLKQKDALDASQNTGEFKRWGDKPHQQAGRDPKTGRERFDYYQSNEPYNFGGFGRKEPQTSRGQADDATQERGIYAHGAKDPRTGEDYPVKRPARESGEMTSAGDSKISQHKYRTFEVPSSGNNWATGHKVPKEMWDQEPVSELGKEDFEDGKLDYHKIREVPRGGKAPTEGTDTPSKEELKRRNELLPATGKRPKIKPSKKPSKGKKQERTYPKKAWEKWLEKKQTKIDRKQEWGDKSKIGIGSWEDRPELKPKGRKDKKGKRIRERGQGEGNLREGAL